MKILVTGATGYIGGSVAERLVALGHRVSGLVRSENKILPLKKGGIESVLGTLDDSEILAHAADEAGEHPGVLRIVPYRWFPG